MAVKIIGLKELQTAVVEIEGRLDETEKITDELKTGMRKVVHIITGHLKSTIYSKGNFAGAKADYAGFEADRYGDHDYAQWSIDAFNDNKYLDWVVEPF